MQAQTYNVLFALIFCAQLNAQSPAVILPDLEGDALLTELSNQYTPAQVLDYGEARDLMYGTIYNVNDSTSCIYTGHKLYLPPGVDPSTHLYMNGSADGINAEHTYPRSKGAEESGGNPNSFSDMHHLFATRTAVNAARGNLPFGDVDDNQTISWFYRNQTQSGIPSINIELYSELGTGHFEPAEQSKGNIARAMFYFFTIYNEKAIAADPDFFEAQRATLCEWDNIDPADDLELERTFFISDYQSGIANPFIVDCTLASRSYCQDFDFNCADVSTSTEVIEQESVALYPNPVDDILHIDIERAAVIRVLDIYGRILMQQKASGSTDLDLSSLLAGVYIVQVNQRAIRIIKR